MAALMTSMGFHEMVIPALLFLILVALLFPGLLRAVFFMIGLFALCVIGISNRAHDARESAPSDPVQQDVYAAPAAGRAAVPPHQRSMQEIRTASGAYMCMIDGMTWEMGLCPPHRP